jgi:hypothetical protein
VSISTLASNLDPSDRLRFCGVPPVFRSKKFTQTIGFNLFPSYICVHLSMSEQLVHLSAAAHMCFALFSAEGTKLMPTQLYIDTMIVIKNVYFCVAKAKVDDPSGKFYIMLGADGLKLKFGILRKMVGNDRNIDMLQRGDRIRGATEVSTILAKMPSWEKPPRC